jgi:integrase
MPRPLKGSVIEHPGADGRTYRSLRFQAGGKRHRVPLGAVSEADAERALAHTIADVERGTWTPPTAIQPPAEPSPVPTFREFASEWWTVKSADLTPGTRADYSWRLQVHLLKFFGELRLDEITFDACERYVAAKRKGDDEGPPLSPRSVNMHMTLLAAILERAVERELIVRNPAKGKGRRVRERAPRRSYLDAAGQIVALLDAAGELDRDAPENRRHVERRAMLATLTFAGLRISELCSLRWRDMDLAGGWISVEDSKTDAGRRRVKIRGTLRDELLALRGRHQDAPQGAYVFGTRSGKRMSPDNFRSRVLGRPAIVVEEEDDKPGTGAVGRANRQLEAKGLPPLPDKLTPHSLRRTFCSLLYALGEDPGTVMDEMGHTDPALALRVYRQAMRRSAIDKALLRELVEGRVVANSGQRDEIAAPERPAVEAA